MKHLFSTTLMILALSLFAQPASAQSFAMGDIEVLSGYNQGLHARIPLYGLRPDGYSTLAGRVVGYDDMVEHLDFEFQKNGRQIYFVIKSPSSPVQNLDIQVFLSYKGQERMGEYVIVAPQPKSVQESAPQISRFSKPRTDSNKEQFSGLAQISPRGSDIHQGTESDLYADFVEEAAMRDGDKVILPFRYEVQRGDTISSIVDRHIKPYDAGFYRSVVALYNHNRSAFVDEDINRLIAGKALTVPERQWFFHWDESQARRHYFALVDGARLPGLEVNNLAEQNSPEQSTTVEQAIDEAALDQAREIAAKIRMLISERDKLDQQIAEHQQQLSDIETNLSDKQLAGLR